MAEVLDSIKDNVKYEENQYSGSSDSDPSDDDLPEHEQMKIHENIVKIMDKTIKKITPKKRSKCKPPKVRRQSPHPENERRSAYAKYFSRQGRKTPASRK